MKKLLFTFYFLIFAFGLLSQSQSLDVANKCEEPIWVNVWAVNDCPLNGPSTPISTGWFMMNSQTVMTIPPLYNINTWPFANWHIVYGSTTINGVVYNANVRHNNPTHCNPTMAAPDFFSGLLFAIWYNYTNIGFGESVVFSC